MPSPRRLYRVLCRDLGGRAWVEEMEVEVDGVEV